MSTDPADYRARAELHRPKTTEELRAAIQNLLGQGMSEHGIADIFSLNVEAVRRLAGCRDCE